MTPQTFQLPDTFWIVFVDYSETGLGIGGADPLFDWDDAVDRYADATDQGEPARIFSVDMRHGNASGVVQDVTGDADDTLSERVVHRHKAALGDTTPVTKWDRMAAYLDGPEAA